MMKRMKVRKKRVKRRALFALTKMVLPTKKERLLDCHVRKMMMTKEKMMAKKRNVNSQ
jgi:hypothetical protein